MKRTKFADAQIAFVVRRLKQLDEENSRLKRLAADLSVDEAMLQDVIKRAVGRRTKSSKACS